MSLEDKIEALTKAVEANTAALLAGGGAAPAAASAPAAGKGGKGGKTTEKADTPKVSRDEMVKALNEVKESKGVAEAKRLIKEVGGADKMADIPDGKIEVVYKAAKELLTAEEEEGI